MSRQLTLPVPHLPSTSSFITLSTYIYYMMSGMKLSFSLTNHSKKKKNKLEVSAATAAGGGGVSSPMEGFEPLHSTNSETSYRSSGGYSTDPLIIPVQTDHRLSLQEQARLRRTLVGGRNDQEAPPQQPLQGGQSSTSSSSSPPTNPLQHLEEGHKDEDQAAIEALTNEAGGPSLLSSNHPSLKMVIQGSQNTFQRGGGTGGGSGPQSGLKDNNPNNHKNNENNSMEDDDVTFQQELNRYAPELSVDSASYRQVPISDFGAAMLRGMGWTGHVTAGEGGDEMSTLPRPSRLGLGATPKLLDASLTTTTAASAAPPTHSGSHKRMRRQDQVQRDQQLKQQQTEYEKKRLQQIKLDKQRTIQDGSIVWVESSLSTTTTTTTTTRRRAVIRKWQGVPGLNMCLIQFEKQEQPEQQQDTVKVKKGDVRLIDREELHVRPFVEPKHETREERVQYLGMDDSKQEIIRDPDGKDSSKEQDKDHRRDAAEYDDERRDRKHRRDEESTRHQDRKRHRLDERSSHASRTHPSPSATITTWLIPHIRVRVVSSKVGKQFYKEKGIVVDVTRNGTATLTMGNGQVIQAPERYLETALPKVGGNACILVGEHRLAKGKLLERDSRKNRGAVQVFEDMNIVTTSLDDMAEWCGPLDDDLMLE